MRSGLISIVTVPDVGELLAKSDFQQLVKVEIWRGYLYLPSNAAHLQLASRLPENPLRQLNLRTYSQRDKIHTGRGLRRIGRSGDQFYSATDFGLMSKVKNWILLQVKNNIDLAF